MNWLRKPALMYALLGLALACSPLMAAHAWVDVATISSTVGNTNGRLCTGLGRADIGCPSNAPFFDSTTGRVGIGTNSPSNTLHVVGTFNDPILRVSSGNYSIGMTQSNIFSNGGNLRINGSSSNNILMTPSGTGRVGIQIDNVPSTTLHVSGTLRIANGGETCDANRIGAIRYTSGDFQFCRNGTAWEPLASIADSAAPDRIISGTTTMAAVSNTGFISITQAGTNTGWFDPQRGLVTLGVSATGTVSGTSGFFRTANVGPSADQSSYAPFVVKQINDTNSGGLAIVRSGAATASGRIFVDSNNTLRITRAAASETLAFTTEGRVGIGTVSPVAQLDVSGSLKIAGSGSEVCGPGTYGTMRRNPTTGHLQICTEAQ